MVARRSIFTGNLVEMPAPTRGQTAIEDVSHALSNICRCGGWTCEFFSVAQHCLEVATLCSKEAPRFGVNPNEAAMAGLLHDAPEAFTGDVISPMKRALGESFKTLDAEITSVVMKDFRVVGVMERCREVVKWADLEMLASDMARWDCFGVIVSNHGDTFRVDKHRVVPSPFVLRFPDARAMPPPIARGAYLTSFQQIWAALEFENRLDKTIILN